VHCYLLFFSLSSILTSLTLRRIIINYIFIIILSRLLSIHTRFKIFNNGCSETYSTLLPTDYCTFICKVTSIFKNFCCFNSICKIFSFGYTNRVLLKEFGPAKQGRTRGPTGFHNYCIIIRKLSTTITSSIFKISSPFPLIKGEGATKWPHLK